MQLFPVEKAAECRSVRFQTQIVTHRGGESQGTGESHHHCPEEAGSYHDHEELPDDLGHPEAPAVPLGATDTHADSKQNKHISQGGAQ